MVALCQTIVKLEQVKLLEIEMGIWLLAYAFPTQFYTNNFNEAQALLIEITWCCEQQFSGLDLELDSMIIVQSGNL